MLSWTELYRTGKISEYTKIRYTLENHHIPTKIKVISSRNRMANDVVLGGNPFVLNSGGMKESDQVYQIYIKKQYLNEARKLMSELDCT